MSDYHTSLAKLELMYAKLVKDTDGPISNLVHSYEIQTRDLIAILLPLLKELAPK